MSEWVEGRLKDLVEINPSTKLIKGKVYPFISMDVIKPYNKFVTSVENRVFKGSGSKFKKNDVLFARITPCLENGKTAQAIELKNEAAFGSTEFIVLRGKGELTETDFVYYLCIEGTFRERAKRLMVGTSGRQRVDKEQFENIKIKVPPIYLQKKVISILGSLDKKIELNRKMNETLEKMAMALYKHWFVDFGPFQDGEFVESELGMIPKGWQIGKLKQIAQISTKSINPSKHASKQFVHFSIPAFDENTLPKIQLGAEIKSNKYLLQDNAILISKLNPRIYRIWTIYQRNIGEYPPICSTEFINYQAFFEGDWSYLNCLFRSDEFISEFRMHAAGTTGSRQRVTPKVTLDFKILIPPAHTKNQFNRVINPYFSQININKYQNQELKNTRDYLLPRLISGQIDLSEVEEATKSCIE